MQLHFAGNSCFAVVGYLGESDLGSGDGGSGVGGLGERSSGIGGLGDGGSGIGSVSNWGSSDGNWSSLGVGEGLVDGLADVGGGANGSDDGLLSEDGLVPEDGLSSEVSVLNGGRLDVGNRSGLVDNGGLSNGVGDGVQLGGDLGESLSGDNAVSKVSAETVALDGGAVVLGGTDDVGGSRDGGSDGGNDASVGDSQKTSNNDEGLKSKGRFSARTKVPERPE